MKSQLPSQLSPHDSRPSRLAMATEPATAATTMTVAAEATARGGLAATEAAVQMNRTVTRTVEHAVLTTPVQLVNTHATDTKLRLPYQIARAAAIVTAGTQHDSGGRIRKLQLIIN